MIRYKDLIDLGFNRYDMNDSLAKDQYGYDDFYLFLKMGNNMEIHWHPQNTDEAKLIRFKKSNVLNFAILKDLETIKGMIDFFTINNGNENKKLTISKCKCDAVNTPMYA